VLALDSPFLSPVDVAHFLLSSECLRLVFRRANFEQFISEQLLSVEDTGADEFVGVLACHFVIVKEHLNFLVEPRQHDFLNLVVGACWQHKLVLQLLNHILTNLREEILADDAADVLLVGSFAFCFASTLLVAAAEDLLRDPVFTCLHALRLNKLRIPELLVFARLLFN